MFATNSAYAQVTCIQMHLATKIHKSLGFAPSDVENLVSKVANSIGLSPAGISIIPCNGINKVQSIYYDDRKDVPKGEYILYEPVWVREVVGNNLAGEEEVKTRDQAVFIFGHELGHLLGRHFTSRAELPRLQKETEADHFGGCAVGTTGGKWQNVQDIINRIRGDSDTDYPSREHSLATAKDGFDGCPERVKPQVIQTPTTKLFTFPNIAARAGDGPSGSLGAIKFSILNVPEATPAYLAEWVWSGSGGSQGGRQDIIFDLKADTGATLQSLKFGIDRNGCYYGGGHAERKSGNLTVPLSLIAKIEVSASILEGRVGKC
jgi:hypothetical protein